MPSPTKDFYPFKPGQLEKPTSQQEINGIVETLNGNLDGEFLEISHLLAKEHCKILVDNTEIVFQKALLNPDTPTMHWKTKTNITDDFRLDLTMEDIVALIGTEATEKVQNAFQEFTQEPVTEVVVRRSQNDGSRHIQYHTDGPLAVMHLYLNGDNLDGGNLHYLTHDGVVGTTAPTGHGIFHQGGVVHGVSSFVGTRYIFIFLAKMNEEVVLGELHGSASRNGMAAGVHSEL